jgi:hypothetical protein
VKSQITKQLSTDIHIISGLISWLFPIKLSTNNSFQFLQNRLGYEKFSIPASFNFWKKNLNNLCFRIFNGATNLNLILRANLQLYNKVTCQLNFMYCTYSQYV